MRMKKIHLIGWFGSAVIWIMGCAPTAYKVTPIPISDRLEETVVATEYGVLLPKIALVDIDGTILNAREASLLGGGENKMALVVEKLTKAAADPSVKAVVLRINSPGGSVTASDILYHEVLKVRSGDAVRCRPAKPVVAAMMDVAASGGYYVACGANEIVAEPSTVTGSIGVVMLTINAKGLLDKVGITTDAIKSGQKKDAGSPFRPMEPEERQVFQDMINEFYEGFLTVVSRARPKLDSKRIRELADGRVYSGRQAQKLGLIDRVGSLEDAITRAKELAGVRKAKVVMYHRPVKYQGSIYAASEPVQPQMKQSGVINVQVPDFMQQQGAFLYLWQP